jgi:L-alanine-DL-glutamate epimerase-like enolase superfamily enzyme
MLAQPLRVNDQGMIVLGTKPGMGYELNEEMLAKTRMA